MPTIQIGCRLQEAALYFFAKRWIDLIADPATQPGQGRCRRSLRIGQQMGLRDAILDISEHAFEIGDETPVEIRSGRGLGGFGFIGWNTDYW